jgi:hypothetical protein
MAVSMRDIGKRINSMVMAKRSGQMELHLKVVTL